MDLREHAHAGTRRHPWETARARFFRDVLRESGRMGAVARVLDVGAGDGWLARALLDECPASARLTCVDSNYDDAWLARRDDPRVTFARAAPDEAADLVLALDVAEHVDDDAGFARDLAAHLAPGGALLFSVPTWPALFTSHDVALGHHRRYTPEGARRLVEGAGLAVERSGGLFLSLVAPRAAQAALERVRPPREVAATSLSWKGGAALTSAVESVLRADAAVARWASSRALPLPGLSWWALCTRAR